LKHGNGKILPLLVFLLMMVPAIATNVFYLPESDLTEPDLEITNEEEQFTESLPQNHGTRGTVEREGTVLDEEYSELIMPCLDYYSTIGWEFEVQQDCIVTQLGVYKFSHYPYYYYNLRIWDSIGNILVEKRSLKVEEKNWTWFDIPSISLSPGTYTISAYVRGYHMTAINNP
jgi:hypothetical protein